MASLLPDLLASTRALAPALTLLPALGLLMVGCPRVPASLTIDEAPPNAEASTRTNPAKPGEGADFDVDAALAGAERALLAVDAIRTQAGPREYDYDAMGSYLQDEGLRSLYFFARAADVSLWTIGLLFDAPVFLDGPHADHPEYGADHFGGYNPVFVERVTRTARALGEDRARVARTQDAFDRQLRQQALCYLLVYEAIHRDPAWYARLVAAERARLVDPRAGDLWAEQQPMVDAFAAAKLSWYEAATAISFWVRRDLDGTASAWRDALEALLVAYGVDTQVEPPGYPG
jgi:hypothetical protein